MENDKPEPQNPEQEKISFPKFVESLVGYYKYLNRFLDPTPGDGPNDPMTFEKWNRRRVMIEQINRMGNSSNENSIKS